MAIELMLLKPVDNLGQPGDVVKVKAGYARNFLLPRRLAAPVSQDALRQAKTAKKRIAEAESKKIGEANIRAELLNSASVHIEVNANEEGHLFGSVTAAMIAEGLGGEGYEVDPHAIQLAEPIKELGIYEVPVRVYADVVSTIKLYVVCPPPKEDAEETA